MDKLIPFIKAKKGIIIACVLYLFTTVFLYFVEFKMYGGVVKTCFAYVVLIPISLFFSWAMSDENKNKNKRPKKKNKYWAKISKTLDRIFTLCVFEFIVYFLYKNPYTLELYYYIAIAIFSLCIYFLDKTKKICCKKIKISTLNIIAYSCILVITFLYILIANPCSVYKGESVLKENGYSNITYETDVTDTYMEFENQQLTQDEKKLDFYMYKADKGKSSYAIFVSAVTGRVVFYDYYSDHSILKWR